MPPSSWGLEGVPNRRQYVIWHHTRQQRFHLLEVRNITPKELDDTGTEHKAGENCEQTCNSCKKQTQQIHFMVQQL